MKDMPKDLDSKMTVLKALLKNMYSMMAKKKPAKGEADPTAEVETPEEEKSPMEEDDMPSLAGLLANKKKKLPKFSLMSMSITKKPLMAKKGKF